MNKRQLKFYWVVLHEWLDREQTSYPPDTVKELKRETKQLSDHLSECLCEKTIPEIKEQVIQLEANNHPDGEGGFAFYDSYCFEIGEQKIDDSTTDDYWDCECRYDYINKKSEIDYCGFCDTYVEDQPDSRVNEVNSFLSEG